MYEHSVQTATRALEDGADIEVVVCGLLHDVGEVITPACHGEVGKNPFAHEFLSAKSSIRVSIFFACVNDLRQKIFI